MLHTKFQSSMPSSFREEDFQRFCCFFSFWLPWQPELWLEFNLLNNFGRASPKEHPCQVSSRLAQWFRRRCLKKLWTPDAGHWAITKAHHEHFVLSWAKNRLSGSEYFTAVEIQDCSAWDERVQVMWKDNRYHFIVVPHMLWNLSQGHHILLSYQGLALTEPVFRFLP